MEHEVFDDPPDGGSSSFPEAVRPVQPWLERARAYGFLGPGPVALHVAHALGFVAAAGGPPSNVVDLGAGGGVPGLVLLAVWPSTGGVLLDGNERRTSFLAEAVDALGWGERVQVLRARAEEAGREAGLRGAFPLVVSRGFGRPAVVAECAAPLLQADGCLVVSEPPGEDATRWPPSSLELLGLVPDRHVKTEMGRFQVLRQIHLCPDRYPRRVGVPAKRPLW